MADSTDLDKLIKSEYTYPMPEDDEFLAKIYRKREFYYHKFPERPEMKNYDDIKEFRDAVCGRSFALLEQQSFLSNFINPDTPYRGVLVFHGTGTGKCLAPNQRVLVNGSYETIEQIWAKQVTKSAFDGEGWWSQPKTSLSVESLNRHGHRVTGRVKHLYRQWVSEPLRRVTLVDGRSIIVTERHPLLRTGLWTNSYGVGDRIGVPDGEIIRYLPVIAVDQMMYTGYVYDLEVDTHHNFIAENIFCHNTCAGIAIAEKFKTLVQKYNTKIYVLIPGPLVKENWRREILHCTGETYLKYQDSSVVIDEQEKKKAVKNAMNQVQQYYRFMTYRSFYKKVLGERIVERKMTKDNKVKLSYRKNEEGAFERDMAVDRIYNLNNSLIVVDEAHQLTGNSRGEALMKVIHNSVNLKVVLLTATPMKNKADDVIELINFLRPPEDPIIREKVFNSYTNHQMDFRPGGIDYLKKMTRGYVSHLRGADPVTFAIRVDKGVRPKGLQFTTVIPCTMMPFQQQVYDEAAREVDDALDRRSEAVANFVFPGLSTDRKSIKGYYGIEGLTTVMNQLKTHYDVLNKKISTELLPDFDTESDGDMLYLSEANKTLTGAIMKMKYLKRFSTKFYRAMKKLGRLFWGRKGAKTAFVYSNLVRVGIQLFQEILTQNGYLEYQENANNYTISGNTICYYCGRTYQEHEDEKLRAAAEKHRKSEQSRATDHSDSSTEYQKKSGLPPKHEFHPATFISVTGGSSEDVVETIPEDKKRILDEAFNHLDNKEGKFIKLVLGSKVMTESISLKNVSEVHIVDVHFNLGSVDQVIGRAIRHCSHYALMSDDNRFPKVNVYKYAVVLEKEISSEVDLYRKAELKYLLVKKVERAIKETAIDCPLNRNANMFKEEIDKYKKCGEPGEIVCPNICDYTKCEFMCDGRKLNANYYDSSRNIYKMIVKSELDYSTFTHTLAQNEIDYAKKMIKNMYRTKFVYTLPDILDYVKATYTTEKQQLFDNFFVYKALDELIPVTENDFNNYRDTILDKFNQPGYLIYVDRYYIFQPFDQNEDVPMYYRTTFDKPILNKLSLYNYLQSTEEFHRKKSKSAKKKSESVLKEETAFYDFEAVMEYYDNRKEFEYVGIIDKEASRRRVKKTEEMLDVFKIRERRAKVLEKKRATGIPSLKGAVCSTSKSKQYLEKIAKKIGLKIKTDDTRLLVCEQIRERFVELEKYSTGPKKMTYLMVPKNHSNYPFPLNLEDRLDYLKQEIKKKIHFKIEQKVKTMKQTSGKWKGQPYYQLTITRTDALKEFADWFSEHGAKQEGKQWVFTLE